MIAIACDHSALELKAEIEKLLEERGLEYKDFGTYTAESCPLSRLCLPRCAGGGRRRV